MSEPEWVVKVNVDIKCLCKTKGQENGITRVGKEKALTSTCLTWRREGPQLLSEQADNRVRSFLSSGFTFT